MITTFRYAKFLLVVCMLCIALIGCGINNFVDQELPGQVKSGAPTAPWLSEPEYAEYPQAVQDVVAMYKMTSSIANPEVEVLDYQVVIWGDSCLELGYQGEDCPQVPTPGWQVILRTDVGIVEIHTDHEGHFRRK